MKPGELKDWLMLVALGGIGYVLYTIVNKVPDALDKAGSAIGGKAADFRDFASEAFFGPRFAMRYFRVNFAGGVVHAIPIKSQETPDGVDEKGRFTFRGKKFVMRDRKLPNGLIEHWAFDP